MGTIVYLSIRLACACYILYKVCGQKKKIREICDLLYAKLPPVKKKEPENVLSEPGGESGVMGSTRKECCPLYEPAVGNGCGFYR